jgi:hypothetical protein
MKKLKNCISVFLAAVMMTAAFCIPALAVVSQYDNQYLSGSQQQDIQNATNAWWDAYHAGDQAGMDAAHKAAEDVRATAQYSGGQDGSEYHPWGGSSGGGGGSSSYDYYTPPITYYSISASAGTGGSISPSGSTSIASGGSKAYTITANTGYKIADVKVDGSSIGSSSTYTFSNVTSSHTISATFASAASLSAETATMGDGGAGTLKSGITKSGYGLTASLPVTASHVSGTTVTASYNFTGAKTIALENVGGTWQFPVNNSSVAGARKIYIPVETKDGTYTITFTVKALDPQTTALTGNSIYLTSTKTVTITVKGSMFEDDFTGNS